jgi:type II secretory pathway pseudopilin PulG
MIDRRQNRAAFTLVELLIAVGITAIIVVLLGTMFGSLTSSASRANQRIDAFRDARAALQMIERDLNNLVCTQWQPEAFTNPPPWQPITRPAAYLALQNIFSDPAPGNQQLYALVATKNSGQGDVCSVGYYCSWDGDAYTLRRFFRPSDQTYTTLSSPAPTPALSPRPSPTPTPVYKSETDLYKPNPSPSPSPTDQVLARHVWNLKVTAYDAAGNALPYPLLCDGSATNPISPAGTARPAAIEVSFRAMSAEAARTVMTVTSDPKDWMDETQLNYLRLIKPHAYEFRTRIKL